MKNLKNKVQLIGNLGRDVEFKELENGGALAKVTMATNDYYKNNKGDKVEEVQWHNLIAWGPVAERMNQHLKKGKEIIVQGKLVHRAYEDKEGIKKNITEVIVNEFMMINGKEKSTE